MEVQELIGSRGGMGQKYGLEPCVGAFVTGILICGLQVFS
jgi:hypothetical protein